METCSGSSYGHYMTWCPDHNAWECTRCPHTVKRSADLPPDRPALHEYERRARRDN